MNIVNNLLITNIDNTVIYFIQSIRNESLTTLFKYITLFGNGQILIIVTMVLTIIGVALKRWHILFTFLISVVSSALCVALLKQYFQRIRPETALYLEPSFSFPSGHSSISVAFYGIIGFLFIQYSTKLNQKIIIGIMSIIMILAIGSSRLYLGVHYFSDVCGGYLIGTIWLLGAIFFYKKYQKSNIDNKIYLSKIP